MATCAVLNDWCPEKILKNLVTERILQSLGFYIKYPDRFTACDNRALLIIGYIIYHTMYLIVFVAVAGPYKTTDKAG